MLTERQENILRLIIQAYTESEQPVGSKKLREDGIEASPATIRNEMKMLEEYGLLAKTHSSSGRVPSMMGYRYYVDHLLQPVKVQPTEVQWIRESFDRDFQGINDIIQQSAEVLSSLTSYTTFSLGPDVRERILTNFQIIPLNSRQVIVLIVTDSGNVESQVLTTPRVLAREDVAKMELIINDKLVGQPLSVVYQKLRTEIPMILHRYFQSTEGILDLFESMLQHSFKEKVFVSGRMNMLNFDATRDITELQSMYSLMKDTEELNQLLMSRDSMIQIRIGAELGNELLANMSLIQANYEIAGHGQGTIALLGPTNMPYSKMFGLLDVFCQELTGKLVDYYRPLDMLQ